MISPRDRLPYAEHVDRLKDGTALFAIQNLTAKDMATLAQLVRFRRSINSMHLVDTTLKLTSEQLDELAAETIRLDNLHEVLKYGAQG